jgi:CPA1 family monovalent cation:H+ antiporter
VAAAGSLSAGEVVWLTMQTFFGGIAVGLAGGVVLTFVAKQSRDTTVANALLLVAPLPIYGATEAIGGSGILAVVIAALLFAHRTSSAVAYTGRLQATSVWRTVVFILQSGAFFLIGIEIPAEFKKVADAEVAHLLYLVPAAIVVLIAVRFLFVFAMSRVNPGLRRHPREWIVMGWSGTRGPISVLAAFTIPLYLEDGSPFPHRSLLISITSGVVVVSLLLALTIPAVARWADLPKEDDAAALSRVRVALARSALARLDEVAERADRVGRPIAAQELDRLRGAAEMRLDLSAQAVESRDAGKPVDRSGANVLAAQMIQAEQEELLRLRDEEGLPDSLMRTLQEELDLRLKSLARRASP